ncbi:hypothetical protein [Corynebacterium durum]|uniref:hypothetical protein n=1 Tax=Corynebacterium durum TaxID=61592 RepID=UPI0028EE9FA8|nr:hypothetical protein [Corynebacterium durum]
MKIGKKISATVVAVSLMIGANSVANAQEQSAVKNPSAVTVEDGKQATKPLSQEKKSVVDKAIDSGSVKVATEKKNLAVDKAITAENKEGQTLVMIPIINVGSKYSNLTLVLDTSSKKVEAYKEAHFFEESATAGRAVIWEDGKQIKDERVEATKEDLEKANAEEGIGDAISELNRCLSEAGIPAWIIAAAGFACSLASLPGYIACLVAAGVGGGTAGYCGASAWSKL